MVLILKQQVSRAPHFSADGRRVATRVRLFASSRRPPAPSYRAMPLPSCHAFHHRPPTCLPPLPPLSRCQERRGESLRAPCHYHQLFVSCSRPSACPTPAHVRPDSMPTMTARPTSIQPPPEQRARWQAVSPGSPAWVVEGRAEEAGGRWWEGTW